MSKLPFDNIDNKFVIYKQGTSHIGCPFVSAETAVNALKLYKADGTIPAAEADQYVVAEIEIKVVKIFN